MHLLDFRPQILPLRRLKCVFAQDDTLLEVIKAAVELHARHGKLPRCKKTDPRGRAQMRW
jgi:hypothetical protein